MTSKLLAILWQGGEKSSIKPKADFNVGEDVVALRKAMEGLGRMFLSPHVLPLCALCEPNALFTVCTEENNLLYIRP